MKFEQLIAQQRPHIDQVVRDLARRHYLAPAEIEEFRTTVVRAIERNDFELLRAFDGRSTWETYLSLVVTREFFLFQGVLWGQWRPTGSARRLGPAGVLLEELVLRDRLSVSESIELMRSVHRVDLPRYRLQKMAEQLQLTSGAPTMRQGSVPNSVQNTLGPAVQSALRGALALLSPDDRLILELRFRDRQPLARIAKMMGVDGRPLQRRLEHVKDVIGHSLIREGIPRHDVELLLQHADGDAADPRQKWWQAVLTRPTKT